MSILDKIKSLFTKKDFLVKNVSKPPSEEAEEENNVKEDNQKEIEIQEEINEEEESEELENEEESKTKVEEQEKLTVYNKEEVLEILDSIDLDKEKLALDKIQSEAETINSYTKLLIKDLSLHQDYFNEKDKLDQVIKGISGKIKVITNHGLELKNLLGNLEGHYYDNLLEGLKKVYEKTKNEQIEKLILDLEKDLELIKTLDTQLTKVIGYNELFNPEKNPKYKEAIEKEATKRIVHGDLNDLLTRILNAVTNRSIGAKSKIEKFDYVKIAKDLV